MVKQTGSVLVLVLVVVAVLSLALQVTANNLIQCIELTELLAARQRAYTQLSPLLSNPKQFCRKPSRRWQTHRLGLQYTCRIYRKTIWALYLRLSDQQRPWLCCQILYSKKTGRRIAYGEAAQCDKFGMPIA